MHDLLIIGSGSAGVAAAIEASGHGAKVAVIERGTVGGTCVNVGCVPSKTLLRAAEANHRANGSSFAGVAPKGSELDFGSIIAQKNGLVEDLRQHKYVDVIDSFGVPLIRGIARFSGPDKLEVHGKEYRAKRFLIATGAAPTLPPIPGLSESRPWTYIDALSPDRQPASLVVIGGGPIGLELAQAYARLGTRVTILEALPHILSGEEEQVSEELRSYLEAEGIEIHTDARVSNVAVDDDYRVTASTRGGERSFQAERLLVATGRRPRTEELGLEQAGVRLNPGGAVEVDRRLATANPAIYAAGDVAGLPQFVYVGAQAGRLAARNALGVGNDPLDLSGLPRVTFSDPAVAAVGLTEAEARAAHKDVRVSVLAMDQVPRALAAFDTRGFVKLVTDGEGQILGVHALAPEAGELIQEGILAVKFGLNYRDLIDTYHPYLTAVESLRLAAQAFDTDVKQLSCCA
ncbi:MAG: mercury(II) reductase [Trueperaceae bacterium]